MKTYDVVFYEVYKEEETLLKKLLPQAIKAKFIHQTIQESKDVLPASRFVCTRTQSTIPKSWAKNLDAVLTRSQGYDHLSGFLKKSKAQVSCGYLGDYCSRSVAEHAIMSMLMLFKKMHRQIKNFDTFNRNNITGRECVDRNALIVGVGNIGKEIVHLTKSLHMNVRGVDIVERMEGLEYVLLSKGVQWAEVIFCALPLTDETNGLLNYKILKQNKAKAALINISRGEITPLNDLKRLLKEDILSGIALDVFTQEGALAQALQSKKQSKERKIVLELREDDRVIFTPHNAFNTDESLERKCYLTIESIEHFLKKGSFPQAVLPQ